MAVENGLEFVLLDIGFYLRFVFYLLKFSRLSRQNNIAPHNPKKCLQNLHHQHGHIIMLRCIAHEINDLGFDVADNMLG